MNGWLLWRGGRGREMVKAAAKKLTWDQAITQILNQANGPLHYTEIAERIIEQDLRDNTGATPAQTINAIINGNIKKYLKLGNGNYALLSWVNDREKTNSNITVKSESDTGAIKSFGMYWDRSKIDWSKPKFIGKQGDADVVVDFSEQVGVYLLHDRERVIYIGRAEDTLLKRLTAHTAGRFGGRWDRFSWFGMRSVDEHGKLGDAAETWDRRDVIETMEAILIECLEPSQNRRRGDNLGANEFVQENNPEFKTDEALRLITGLIRQK